jgi:hypothetical protein
VSLCVATCEGAGYAGGIISAAIDGENALLIALQETHKFRFNFTKSRLICECKGKNIDFI